MKPHSLSTVRLSGALSPAKQEEKFRALGPIAARFGRFEKGTVLPETQAIACPRVKVADLPEGFLPQRYLDALEQNQKIAGCCRHPENHEIEARKSHPEEKVPDIYIFYCTCGRSHRRFCLGATDDARPVWEAA